MAHISNTCVALVGRQLPDNENLGLGYLHAALQTSKIPVTRLVLNDVTDIATIAEDVIAMRASLVGISFPDGGSAVNGLALGEMLFKRGYQGKIIAGGPFATLARHWLLERYHWLDAVVRFAGEEPIVAIARAVRRGADWSEVPGVTTRGGDGEPARVLSNAAYGAQPQHADLPRILGYRVAHVLATRGCHGRCGYCGPAALQELEQREGQRAGLSLAQLRDCGVGGIKERSTDSLCDEMATLYKKGVRYFYFVEDQFLPYPESQARTKLAEIRDGLQRRAVGRFGFSCLLKPERLTAPVMQELIEAGMVRTYFGLEFASAEEGLHFRRRVDPCKGRAFLRQLEDRGVACFGNLMLVHSASTHESIKSAIEYLATIEAGIIETTRMMVYHGTQIQEQLEAEGRLSGNPLRYGYRLADPVAERFSQGFARLRLESLGDYSLLQRTHEVALTLSFANRLHPGRTSVAARLECLELQTQVRALTVRGLRSLLRIIERDGLGEYGLDECLLDIAEHTAGLRKRVDLLERELPSALNEPSYRFAPMRGVAARTLTFTMVGTALAACGGETATDGSSSQRNVGGSNAAASIGGSAGHYGSGGTRATAGGAAASVGGAATTGGTGPIITSDCSATVAATIDSVVTSAVQSQIPCFSGAISQFVGVAGLQVNPSSGSSVLAMYDCTPGSNANATSTAALVQSMNLPECGFNIIVDGGANEDFNSLAAALSQANCTNGCGGSGYSILIDSAGHFMDLAGNFDAATMDCVRKALSGLVFPCLTSTQVCPEPCVFD